MGYRIVSCICLLVLGACREERAVAFRVEVPVLHVITDPLSNSSPDQYINDVFYLDLGGTFVISNEGDFVARHKHRVALLSPQVIVSGSLPAQAVFKENASPINTMRDEPIDITCFFQAEHAKTLTLTYIKRSDLSAYEKTIAEYVELTQRKSSTFAGATTRERIRAQEGQKKIKRDVLKEYELFFYVFSMDRVCKMDDFNAQDYIDYEASLDIIVPRASITYQAINQNLNDARAFAKILTSGDTKYRIQIYQGQNLATNADLLPTFSAEDKSLLVDASVVFDESFIKVDREALILSAIATNVE